MKKLLPLLLLLALASLLAAQNHPLNLTAPNGGEVWTIGSTYDITWTQQDLAGDVTLTLLGPNTNPANNLIAADLPVAAGSYSWTIPASVTPNPYYRVRITATGANGTVVWDISDAHFAIDGGTPPPPPGTLTVTSPNGGETWERGSAYPITWTSENLAGSVRLLLVRYENDQPRYFTIAANVPLADGTYTWNIPAYVVTGTIYKVQIRLNGSYGPNAINDYSDGLFTVAEDSTPPVVPTLALTAPNGGESWEAGSTQAITWTSANLTGNVRLQLIGCAGHHNTPGPLLIAENVAIADGSYNWAIPADLAAGTTFKVRIEAPGANGALIWDLSDANFAITGGTTPPPPAGTLTLTAPNGGESWEKGSAYDITWTSENLTGNVMLHLLRDVNGQPQPLFIASDLPAAAGTYSWTIPPYVQPGDGYRVQIRWIGGHNAVNVLDVSDATFAIVDDSTPPPPQTLTLTAPNGGESWETGSTQAITWTSENVTGNVRLQLIHDLDRHYHSPVHLIAGNVPVTDGVYNWTLPAYLNPGVNYRVLIASCAGYGMTVTDASDTTFAITGGTTPPPPPADSLCVTAPNGGEQWAQGSAQTITWTASEYTGTVRIALAKVINGHNHLIRTLGVDIPNTGSYEWTVPLNIPADDDFKIMVKINGGCFDYSDAAFAITAAPDPVKASPNPTAQGTRISFTMGSSAPASVKIYNVKGQVVRTLVDGQTLSGAQSLTWDGRDSRGSKVSDGVYFARIVSKGLNATHRIIVKK